MAIAGAGAVGTPSYLTTAYGRAAAYLSDAGSGNGSGAGEPASSASTAATVVTLSAAAQAQLARESATTFASVTANARAALDALYKAANVAGPLVDGRAAADLSALDRRALYAIANNGGGKFSADEQAVAANELRARFAAVLSPQAAVARLTGDWSQVYKAALDYVQGAGPEEKSTAQWKGERAALQRGYDRAAAAPGSPPAAGGDDPVATFLAGVGAAGGGEGNLRDFSAVAQQARTALDAQAKAAADKGLDLVFTAAGGTGQSVDWSGFDNRELAAVALNQGNRFSPDEVRAANAELGSRTRASLLASVRPGAASADPRTFSLGLLSSYTRMSTEERQAMNLTPAFQDMAVRNYQTTSNLISMLQQGSDALTGLFG